MDKVPFASSPAHHTPNIPPSNEESGVFTNPQSTPQRPISSSLSHSSPTPFSPNNMRQGVNENDDSWIDYDDNMDDPSNSSSSSLKGKVENLTYAKPEETHSWNAADYRKKNIIKKLFHLAIGPIIIVGALTLVSIPPAAIACSIIFEFSPAVQKVLWIALGILSIATIASYKETWEMSKIQFINMYKHAAIMYAILTKEKPANSIEMEEIKSNSK